jgi:hypothetical protein
MVGCAEYVPVLPGRFGQPAVRDEIRSPVYIFEFFC